MLLLFFVKKKIETKTIILIAILKCYRIGLSFKKVRAPNFCTWLQFRTTRKKRGRGEVIIHIYSFHAACGKFFVVF